MTFSVKKINSLVDEAIEASIASKKTILLKYIITLNKNINNTKINLLNHENMIYFNFPKNKKTYICTGETIKLNEPINLDNDKYKIISNTNNHSIESFGINAFDLKRLTSYPWEKIPRQYFIVPMTILKIKAEATTLNINIIIDKKISKENIIKEILKKIDQALIKTNTKKIHQIKCKNKNSYPDKKNYMKMFANTIGTINNTDIQKIVLSKMESNSFTGNKNIESITHIMENKYKNCFNYIIKLNNADFFLGSSPEKIIEIKKGHITSTALAGTSTEKNNLKNDKEINEHSYVVKHIKNILSKYGNKIKQEKTNILKLNYAYHLQTKLTTNNIHNKHILKILKDIYPTPALSGYPTINAIHEIKSLEPFDRGYYAGAVGMYNIKGEGSFFASIRSALIRKNKIYYFAGGGITKESKDIKEWEETEIKLKHIKSIIQPE